MIPVSDHPPLENDTAQVIIIHIIVFLRVQILQAATLGCK